jgi:hypothetical protein
VVIGVCIKYLRSRSLFGVPVISKPLLTSVSRAVSEAKRLRFIKTTCNGHSPTDAGVRSGVTCNGYLASVAVGKRQRLYSGVRIITGCYISF